jgi:hypothetical protein
MLETWTSLVLVSRPDATLTSGAGSQPTAGAGRAARTAGRRRSGGRVALGHGRGELGAGEPVPALASSRLRRLIGNRR